LDLAFVVVVALLLFVTVLALVVGLTVLPLGLLTLVAIMHILYLRQ
jgi:hypothetical protein